MTFSNLQGSIYPFVMVVFCTDATLGLLLLNVAASLPLLHARLSNKNYKAYYVVDAMQNDCLQYWVLFVFLDWSMQE